ncbi:hypothetical protein, partial [Escherichia coli]|uniref:hypothetical protein n=1 Tax=Escherichia coli TaxID=562 RepID=UPI001F49A342
GGTADRNRSHWSTSKTPSYTKSVSWQHHPINVVFYLSPYSQLPPVEKGWIVLNFSTYSPGGFTGETSKDNELTSGRCHS